MESALARRDWDERLSRPALALGVAVMAALLAARLSAPDALDNLDQAKQGLYVVDAYREGRWLVPMEQAVVYPTKPPLMTWLSLALAFLQGRVSELGVRAPSFLGAGLLVWATVRFARRAGATASAAAGVALASSFHVVKCGALARTDMLLAAATALATCEIFESFAEHERASGKAARRLLAAAAFAGIGTITKNPLALCCPVAAVALFAVLEPRARRWLREARVSTWLLALAIYGAIVAAWLLPAYLAAGRPFLDELSRELFGHTIEGRPWLEAIYEKVFGHALPHTDYSDTEKAQPFYYPFAHLASKFLPWTVVALAALPALSLEKWRGKPGEASDPERSAIRFAACALAGALLVFALPRIKRQDHVLPCYPWAAILVGVAIARLQEGKLENLPGKLVAIAFRLIGACALAATIVLPLALRANAVVDAQGWRARVHERGIEPSLDGLAARPFLVLAVAIALAPAGALAWEGARRRRAAPALAGTALAAGLGILLYEHALSESVLTGKGLAVPRFCERARAIAGSRPLVFYGVPGSIPFYFERSQPNVYTAEDALASFRKGGAIVTNRVGKDELLERGADLDVACWSALWSHGDGPERLSVWQLVLLVEPGEARREDDGVSSVAGVWW